MDSDSQIPSIEWVDVGSTTDGRVVVIARNEKTRTVVVLDWWKAVEMRKELDRAIEAAKNHRGP